MSCIYMAVLHVGAFIFSTLLMTCGSVESVLAGHMQQNEVLHDQIT